jgi:hypothetical protein
MEKNTCKTFTNAFVLFSVLNNSVNNQNAPIPLPWNPLDGIGRAFFDDYLQSCLLALVERKTTASHVSGPPDTFKIRSLSVRDGNLSFSLKAQRLLNPRCEKVSFAYATLLGH